MPEWLEPNPYRMGRWTSKGERQWQCGEVPELPRRLASWPHGSHWQTSGQKARSSIDVGSPERSPSPPFFKQCGCWWWRPVSLLKPEHGACINGSASISAASTLCQSLTYLFISTREEIHCTEQNRPSHEKPSDKHSQITFRMTFVHGPFSPRVRNTSQDGEALPCWRILYRGAGAVLKSIQDTARVGEMSGPAQCPWVIHRISQPPSIDSIS